jgi:hypothetical protein
MVCRDLETYAIHLGDREHWEEVADVLETAWRLERRGGGGAPIRLARHYLDIGDPAAAARVCRVAARQVGTWARPSLRLLRADAVATREPARAERLYGRLRPDRRRRSAEPPTIREPLQSRGGLRAQSPTAPPCRCPPKLRVLGVGMGRPLRPRGGARARLPRRARGDPPAPARRRHASLPAPHGGCAGARGGARAVLPGAGELGHLERRFAARVLEGQEHRWQGGIPEIAEGVRVG